MNAYMKINKIILPHRANCLFKKPGKSFQSVLFEKNTDLFLNI